MADNNWTITLKDFSAGYAPLSFTDSLTEIGGGGMASVMRNVDVLDGKLTQGPGLTNLTNGTQDGVVTELINYIMDKAVSDDITYGIGTTKLFKISSTSVTNDGIFPHTITDCSDGESVQILKGNLYYFYNTSTAGNIGKYNFSTFDDDWGSTIPTGAELLTKSPHPSDKKEDILLFGNGRYVGVFISETNNIYPTKLDFGNDVEVSDVLYNASKWYIAVNSGVTGDNRTEGQIYIYDGAALTTTLDDETGIGMQRIGFLYRLNGVIYVAYQDLSSTGFSIGYIAGRQIKPLGKFTGSLPNFSQKTLYKNTILFLSGGLVFSGGALVDTLPFQISQHADGGYTTCGAIAAPFGTPMISSSEGTTYKLAKFSGYDTNSLWKSIVFTVNTTGVKGYIDNISVNTKSLGSSARCDLTIEANQATLTSTVQQITGTGNVKHEFDNFGLAEISDFRIALDWSNGNSTNDCLIKNIVIQGHSVEI